MALFPTFEMVIMRSDCDPTFPFRRLNFLWTSWANWKFSTLLWIEFLLWFCQQKQIEQLCLTSHIHQENAPVSLIWISANYGYILVLSHLPIFIDIKKRKVGQHFCWSCPCWKVFLQKRETRRLPPKGVSTSGSTLSTFFLRKFLREGQCSTALAQGNN